MDKSEMPFGRMMLFLSVLAIMLVAAFMPSALAYKSFLADRAEVFTVTGKAQEDMIFTKAFKSFQQDAMGDLITEYKSVVESGRSENSNAMLTAWGKDRVLLAWHWGGIISYRIQLLFLWALPLMPLILASMVDGYLTREIKKETFVFSSPFRHHYTMLGAVAMLFLLFHWVFMPFHTSMFAPAFLTVGAVIFVWVWITNLPKRI